MKKILAVILVLALSLLFLPGQDAEKIVEEVLVVNIEVPVRVFSGKNVLVDGLEKKDFTLIVNGREREINGFYQVRKKISAQATGAGESMPRLFTLVFNVANQLLDLDTAVDYFFKEIFRPGDRLIMLSNNFYLPDRVVEDPLPEMERIKALLQVERQRIRWSRQILRNRLTSLMQSAKDLIENPENIENARHMFIESYIEYLRNYRDSLLQIPAENVLRLSRHLESKNMEKWVFSFFGANTFYQPNPALDGFLAPAPTYSDLRRELFVADNQPENELAGHFINSGATVHTIYMRKPSLAINIEGSYWALLDNFIATDLENVIAQMTSQTGGNLIESNQAGKFFSKVSEKEDICYYLTFTPVEKELAGHKVEVRLKNHPKLKVVYNRSERDQQDALQGQLKTATRLPLKLTGLRCRDGKLSFNVDYPYAGTDQGNNNLKVRLLIVDKNGKKIADRVRDFLPQEKSEEIHIKLPDLARGSYQIIVEAYEAQGELKDLQLVSFSI